jgi:hypothetical protein
MRQRRAAQKYYKTSSEFWGKADKSVTFWGGA